MAHVRHCLSLKMLETLPSHAMCYVILQAVMLLTSVTHQRPVQRAIRASRGLPKGRNRHNESTLGRICLRSSCKVRHLQSDCPSSVADVPLYQLAATVISYRSIAQVSFSRRMLCHVNHAMLFEASTKPAPLPESVPQVLLHP